MAVIEFTTGEPGSGKSYRRCAQFIVKELLNPKVPTQKGMISNYPIEFDPWVDENGVEQKGLCRLAFELYGLEEEEVKERVRVFPSEEVETWIPSRVRQLRGPWDYLVEEEIDLGGWHIAIDEIHNFAPKNNTKVAEAWGKWLGEIRHEGCTIEFLTQDPMEVAKTINGRAGVRRQLVPSKERRDFAFNIKLDDWYQLGTVIGNAYRPSVWQVEQRKVMSRWKTSDETPFWFNPEFFGVYNSHSASNSTGRSGGEVLPAYKQLSRIGLVFWFLRRNGWRFFVNGMVPRFALIGLIAIAALNFETLYNFGMQFQGSEKREVEKVISPGQVETPAPDAVNVGPDWEKFNASVAAFEARVDRVVEELDRIDGMDQLVAIAPKYAYLATGRRVEMGDEVVRPDGSKVTVNLIDYEYRQVRFDDGVVVRVGNVFGMLEKVSTARASASKLRETVSGLPADGVGEELKQR